MASGLGEADERARPARRPVRRRPPGARSARPEDAAHQGHRGGDERGRAEHGLRPVVEEQAGDGPGYRSEGEEPEEAAVRRRRRAARGRGPGDPRRRAATSRAAKAAHHRDERAQVQGHVEGEAVVGPAEEPGHDDQVPGAADGQELAQPLHEAEHDGLESAHRRGSLTLVRPVWYGVRRITHGSLRLRERTRHPRRGGPRLRPRQRLHLRGQRLRDAAHLRGPALRTGPPPTTAARLRDTPGLRDPAHEWRARSQRLDALLARAENPESYIRLIVSRGVGDISYHFDRVKGPTVVMVVKPYEPFPESHYTEGIAVALVGVRRNHPQALDPAIKSSNLLNNVLAVREAQARGAEEALLLNEEGEVAEGASTNVFVVREGSAPHSAAVARASSPGSRARSSWSSRPRSASPPARRCCGADDLPARRRGLHHQHAPGGRADPAARRAAGRRRPARAGHAPPPRAFRAYAPRVTAPNSLPSRVAARQQPAGQEEQHADQHHAQHRDGARACRRTPSPRPG